MNKFFTFTLTIFFQILASTTSTGQIAPYDELKLYKSNVYMPACSSQEQVNASFSSWKKSVTDFILGYEGRQGCNESLKWTINSNNTIISTSTCPSLYSNIIRTFPETRNAIQNAPTKNLFVANGFDPSKLNLVLEEESEVYLTIVWEGAGWTNTVGYYTYHKDSPPASPADLQLHVLFPNASLQGSAGTLKTGDTRQIGNGPFSAGTVIGFYLVAQGWNSDAGRMGRGLYTHYTNIEFNPNNNQQHTLFYENFPNGCGDLVMTFEDIRLPDGDKDFNDFMFIVRTGVERLLTDLTPPSACGGFLEVAWELESLCTPGLSGSFVFWVENRDPGKINLKLPDDFSRVFYNQSEVNAAFNEWLSTASFSGGCDSGNLSIHPSNAAAPPFSGGETLVKWVYSDGCITLQKSRKFTVLPKPEVVIDLGVTIEVNIQTPDPDKVKELVFALVVTNHNPSENATGVTVQNIPPSPFPFIERIDNGSSGKYDAATGTWEIGTIPAGEYRLLVYRTQMLLTTGPGKATSAVNSAQILPFDQTDPNLANNYTEILVTIGESSGGDDNGIESNGNMASKLALRDHRRGMNRESNHQGNPTNNLVLFNHHDLLTGSVKSAVAGRQAPAGIGFLIPEKGPTGTLAFLSTPADLLGITNAREIIAADYRHPNNLRRAGILGIVTQGEVYEHTKVICDRLTGARMASARIVDIDGKPFIMSHLLHPNGYSDFAVSFIAASENNRYTIDNRWHNEEFEVKSGAEVLNFQVWSVTPEYTIELVRSILKQIENNSIVEYINTVKNPRIPGVYVESGRYINGGLELRLVNKVGASSITIFGTKTLVENGEPQQFSQTVTIPIREKAEIFIPTGNLFDAGFSISNNRDITQDVLYFADGAWMFDIDAGNAMVSQFSTEAEGYNSEPYYRRVERDAFISGRVRTWASLFRSLSPRHNPVDLTAFDQFRFTASGQGVVEVILVKAGIGAPAEQFRTNITLGQNPAEYRIGFDELATREGTKGFNSHDVVSVVFNFMGNGAVESGFNMNVSDLRFLNSKLAETNRAVFYPVYPNPFSVRATTGIYLRENMKVRVEVLNIFGQTVEVIADDLFTKGVHRFEWIPERVNTGLYLIRISSGDKVYSTKVVYRK